MNILTRGVCETEKNLQLCERTTIARGGGWYSSKKNQCNPLINLKSEIRPFKKSV